MMDNSSVSDSLFVPKSIVIFSHIKEIRKLHRLKKRRILIVQELNNIRPISSVSDTLFVPKSIDWIKKNIL